MAPLLGTLKNLRRASRQNFRSTPDISESSSEADTGSDGTAPTAGTITPPSLTSTHSDPALNVSSAPSRKEENGLHAAAPIRPSVTGRRNGDPSSSPNKSNRYSIAAMGGISPSPSTPNLPNMRGALAPYITNIDDKTWVHQKILAIRGEVGDTHRPIDGIVVVSHTNNQMPPIEFPVCASRFKALVSLVPGTNRLRLEFFGPRSAGGNGPHVTHMSVSYVPTLNAPPLQLAILVAKDSPRTFDSVPSRIEREGNGLETAIRKFRMAAYLWQAFTAEEMARHAREQHAKKEENRPGSLSDRRSFRLEEEWALGTSSGRDRDNGIMRSEARVHVIEVDKTMAEIRDLELAQQNEKASKRDGLFPIAMDAISNHFKAQPGQRNYVAALMLDSHWDPQSGVITGHAALGGSNGDTSLALFGSHCLWSYPTCLEEVDACFTDCNPTDTKLVANDCAQAGSSWEACNIGIGAHLHEVGHAFGLPHRPSGVMLRDYVRLHRSFVSREAFSTRTKEKGGPVAADKGEECHWHPLDYLHLRTHPCFKTTLDHVSQDPGVAAWPGADDGRSVVAGAPILTPPNMSFTTPQIFTNGNVTFTAPSGLSHMEMYIDGNDEKCEWTVFEPNTYRITIGEKEVRQKLNKKGKIKVVVRSLAGGQFETQDFSALASKEGSGFKNEGKTFWRSSKLGLSNLPDTAASDVVLKSAHDAKTQLRRVTVYHGQYLNGIEFEFDNDEKQLFGNRGGKEGGDVFEMNLWKGEQIIGFKVKSGHWIDAIQIITSANRTSPWYGGSSPAVHPTSLIPPAGFVVCGISGTCGSWVDGFSVAYRRG